ncbi:DUF937 domain-containing protein [Candidatus Gracilibacteria bacterium]|nr:DUF937 domain-containing protein [Candidatus Gracilibacteria bacterium]
MDLSSMMTDMLKDQAIKAISKKTGMDAEAASAMAAKALPMLLDQLKNNAADPAKAEGLEKAVSGNDGSLLDNLDGINLQDGSKILGHIFGGAQADAEKKAGSSEGLAALAPIVMAALGKANSDSGETAGSLLSNPAVMSMAGKFLDQDGDGDFDKSDMISAGMNFLKKKFSGK